MTFDEDKLDSIEVTQTKPDSDSVSEKPLDSAPPLPEEKSEEKPAVPQTEDAVAKARAKLREKFENGNGAQGVGKSTKKAKAVKKAKAPKAFKAPKVKAPKKVKAVKPAKVKAPKVKPPKAPKAAKALKDKATTGQSGPKIEDLKIDGLNKKEAKVAEVLSEAAGPMKIAAIGSLAFKGQAKAVANSWTRNALRRLVRGDWAEQTGRGEYRPTLIGRRRAKAA